MDLLSAAQLSMFRQAINAASATFNKQQIVWMHLVKKLDYFGDDRPGNTSYQQIPLLAYIQYNAWNVLPIDRINQDGISDLETIIIILNKDYLFNLGYLDTNRNFKFNSDNDRFLVNGIVYKNRGDTPASQGFTETLLQFLICSKDEVETGKMGFNGIISNIAVNFPTPITPISSSFTNISQDVTWINSFPGNTLLANVLIKNTSPVATCKLSMGVVGLEYNEVFGTVTIVPNDTTSITVNLPNTSGTFKSLYLNTEGENDIWDGVVVNVTLQFLPL